MIELAVAAVVVRQGKAKNHADCSARPKAPSPNRFRHQTYTTLPGLVQLPFQFTKKHMMFASSNK